MDEREAVSWLKEGDAGGLKVLVKGFYDRMARVAHLVVRDPALAEDVAQGAFVRATRGFPPSIRPGPWGPGSCASS